MAVGALIALKPLEIQKHLFYEKIIEILQRTYTTTKSQVCYFVSCQTLVFVKKLTILNLWC